MTKLHAITQVYVHARSTEFSNTGQSPILLINIIATHDMCVYVALCETCGERGAFLWKEADKAPQGQGKWVLQREQEPPGRLGGGKAGDMSGQFFRNCCVQRGWKESSVVGRGWLLGGRAGRTPTPQGAQICTPAKRSERPWFYWIPVFLLQGNPGPASGLGVPNMLTCFLVPGKG